MISKSSLIRVNLDPGTWLNTVPSKGIYVAMSESWIGNHIVIVKLMFADGKEVVLHTGIFALISRV